MTEKKGEQDDTRRPSKMRVAFFVVLLFFFKSLAANQKINCSFAES